MDISQIQPDELVTYKHKVETPSGTWTRIDIHRVLKVNDDATAIVQSGNTVHKLAIADLEPLDSGPGLLGGKI